MRSSAYGSTRLVGQAPRHPGVNTEGEAPRPEDPHRPEVAEAGRGPDEQAQQIDEHEDDRMGAEHRLGHLACHRPTRPVAPLQRHALTSPVTAWIVARPRRPRAVNSVTAPNA